MLPGVRRGVLVTAALALALSGCARQVLFPSASTGSPATLVGTLARPEGPGPFPAVVLLHGCGGVVPQTRRWAQWLAAHGYVALAVDSFTPRGITGDCLPEGQDDLASTARFEDAFGALRHLQRQPFVRPDRIAAMGWSQGGVFSMAVVNGPSLDRARARGVDVSGPGFAAAIGLYPGGCFSLLDERVIRPLLVLIGGADDWTLPETCGEMAQRMRARGADVTLVVYPGAYHYFDVEGQALTFLPQVGNRNKPGGCCGATVGYQHEAATRAYGDVEAFLARHLKR
jgi:dienelactone hydrolase